MKTAQIGLSLALVLVVANMCLGAFVPPAGLQLWLKADSITGVSNGGGLSTWADSSGNARDVSTVAGSPTYYASVQTGTNIYTSSPIYNPVVNFTADRMVNTLGHQRNTIIYVSRYTGVNGVPWSQAHGTGASNEYFGAVDNDIYLKNPQTQWVGGLAAASGAFHVLTAVHNDPANANSGSIYMDGILKASGVSGLNSLTYADVIGYRDSYGSYDSPFYGDLAEVMIFSSPLSGADRQAVESYLMAKYLVGEQLAIPEPATLSLLALGGLALIIRRGR